MSVPPPRTAEPASAGKRNRNREAHRVDCVRIVHKGRNIMERLPKHLHASVRRVLRQAWELDDGVKAEQLIRNLAHRLEQEAPGVSETLLEGIDAILTVVRPKLPLQRRRSLACTTSSRT